MMPSVFHDDQHGTAIVVGAALLNGLEIQGKAIENVRVVIAGAGAAGIACAAMLSALGVDKEHIVLVDSQAVVHTERIDLNKYQRRFATRSAVRTLAEALRGADVLIGVSGPGTVTAQMLGSMAERPLVFALANPKPEVSYEVVDRVRPDAIFASGRSDYPHQVNNVLAFPSIVRAAREVRAMRIDDEMKAAACRSIAALARASASFGRHHIIPTPLDREVLPRVAGAVAAAAALSGAASQPLRDLARYSDAVAERVRQSNQDGAQSASGEPAA